MTSNYPHYAGSSLPNDYAIVEQFAGHQDDSALETENEENAEDATPTGSPRRPLRHLSSREFGWAAGYGGIPPSRGRRLSVPHHHNGGMRRPSRGASSLKSPAWGTEQEPLLTPGSPHAESESDDTLREAPESETWQLWLQELKIIAKYTAPVFGLVSRLYPSPQRIGPLIGPPALVSLSLAPMSSSIHYRWRLLSALATCPRIILLPLRSAR